MPHLLRPQTLVMTSFRVMDSRGLQTSLKQYFPRPGWKTPGLLTALRESKFSTLSGEKEGKGKAQNQTRSINLERNITTIVYFWVSWVTKRPFSFLKNYSKSSISIMKELQFMQLSHRHLPSPLHHCQVGSIYKTALALTCKEVSALGRTRQDCTTDHNIFSISKRGLNWF